MHPRWWFSHLGRKIEWLTLGAHWWKGLNYYYIPSSEKYPQILLFIIIAIGRYRHRYFIQINVRFIVLEKL